MHKFQKVFLPKVLQEQENIVARAVAGEAKVPVFHLSGSDLLRCLLVLELHVLEIF